MLDFASCFWVCHDRRLSAAQLQPDDRGEINASVPSVAVWGAALQTRSFWNRRNRGFKLGCVTAFEVEIERRLAEIRQRGLHRGLRRIDGIAGTRVAINGRFVLNCSSNDYLGLAGHPEVVEAALKATMDYGSGSRASRSICGSLALHHALEAALAEFENTEAALSFSSGYTTAISTIPALVGPGDVVVLDKLAHGCHVDGARLSRAKLRVYPHNDLERLEEILRWADQRAQGTSPSDRPRTLIITESVFSMDGDHAPLRELVDLKDRYGAWLMVDEAHATGLYGPRRTGLAEKLGVAERIEVRMGTLGKALGAAGGYICGSASLIEYLVNKARSFIFSTAPPPSAAGAALAAVRIVASEEGRRLCDRVWANTTAVVSRFRSGVQKSCDPGSTTTASSLIVPLIIGDEQRAVEVANALFEQGIFIPAVRFPTVPRGSARLRLTLTAAHTASDVAELLSGLQSVGLIEGRCSPAESETAVGNLSPAQSHTDAPTCAA